MAGGIGSRFWPISRAAYPKQFLDILNTGKTLLQSTYDRFLTFIPNENIYIITAEEYVKIVREQLPDLPSERIIGEPERKNTGPCIAYISFKLKKTNPHANLIIAPSDHLIEDQAKFEADCLKALNFTAHNNVFVTLGVQPTHANTGYGYIEYGTHSPEDGINEVLRFTEKPDRATAIEFVNNSSYLWNSGIFIWKAEDIVNAFRQYMPEMYDAFTGRVFDFNTSQENAAVHLIYKNCKAISIDYAILETAKNMYVIPASFRWSDLGTWNSAWENIDKDDSENAVSGDNTLMVDANGCIVYSTESKLVLVGGVQDLIVVNTPDALMICKKENEQQIKEYLVKVRQSKGALNL